jgi:hypothetical protein
MRTHVLLTAVMLAATPGCAYVTANQNATNTVSGELWYVKQRALFGLVFSSRVFHCAPPSSGPAKCKEANIAEGASLGELAKATADDSSNAAKKGADDAKSEKDKDTKDADKDKGKDKDKSKDKDKDKKK